MNYERTNKLIIAINESSTFSMGGFFTHDGAGKCVAGHLAHLPKALRRSPKERVWDTGRHIEYGKRLIAIKLGVTRKEASSLFWADYCGGEYESIADVPKERVLRELRRLVRKYRARDRRVVDKVYGDLMRRIKQKPKQKEMV